MKLAETRSQLSKHDVQCCTQCIMQQVGKNFWRQALGRNRYWQKAPIGNCRYKLCNLGCSQSWNMNPADGDHFNGGVGGYCRSKVHQAEVSTCSRYSPLFAICIHRRGSVAAAVWSLVSSSRVQLYQPPTTVVSWCYFGLLNWCGSQPRASVCCCNLGGCTLHVHLPESRILFLLLIPYKLRLWDILVAGA